VGPGRARPALRRTGRAALARAPGGTRSRRGGRADARRGHLPDAPRPPVALRPPRLRSARLPVEETQLDRRYPRPARGVRSDVARGADPRVGPAAARNLSPQNDLSRRSPRTGKSFAPFSHAPHAPG